MLRTNNNAAVAFGPAAFGAADRPWADRVVAQVKTTLQQVTRWHARRQGRRRLAMLDAHLLRDIGLTRDDVHREANKPFWRA